MAAIMNRAIDPSRIWVEITKKWQFSAFNEMPTEARKTITGASEWCLEHLGDLMGHFDALALRELSDKYGRALPPTVILFWSPQSMVPKWSDPKWNWDKVRIFSVAEIDPARFRFGEIVREGHPKSGWWPALPGEPIMPRAGSARAES